ncbi:Plug and carboxypeptidase regulatory-like domain-containing protein, partial [bacterium]|nr:Plug and carboxypeptidase regulatory-like domain-containing protein [bacterium]
MKLKLLVIVFLLTIVSIPAMSQVSTKTGSIFGKVVDEKNVPLPGVSISLESKTIQSQSSTSGPTGAFRFANLPPGTYAVIFSIEGFTEVRQEDVRVTIGGSVNLEITLNPTLAEEFVVVADTPVVDTKKTGNESTFNREYLDKVPSGRDPWVIIEQTPGVDNDRVNIAGSESGQQTNFFARGASFADNAWNYDGVNATDPLALGATPTYYDFDAFEEIQIQSGGMDASVGAKGVVVNLVT